MIVFTAPLVVAIYERVLHDESLPPHAYGAMIVAVGGLAVAILGAGEIGAVSLLGLVLAVLTMFAYAATVIMAARLQTTLPPLARTGAALVVASLMWAVIVPPWLLPYDLLGETTTLDGRFGFSLPVWVGALFIVVVGSVLVYTCFFAGTSRHRARSVECRGDGRADSRRRPRLGLPGPEPVSAPGTRHRCGRRGDRRRRARPDQEWG